MTREIKDRQWWPSEYADEVMPGSFDSPQGWLMPMPDGSGGFTIKSPHHDSPEDEREEAWKFEALTDGEKIEFTAYDDFGDLSVNIAADGTYTIVNGVLDPRATHFWEWFNNEGPAGDTLAEFAKMYAESEGAADDVHVGMGSWSHTETFAVQIKDGAATLVSAGNA